MNLSKKIKIAAIMLAAFIVTGCGNEVNLGYVDGGRIMNESAQLKDIMEEGAKKIEEIQQQTSAEIEDNPDLTDEEISQKNAELQRKLIGINQAYATQIRHKLDEALASISQEKNLGVVVDSSSAQPLVFHGGVDVTEDVLKKLQ